MGKPRCTGKEQLLLPKPLAIFRRRDEGFDHLGLNVVSVIFIQLVQPEVIAAVLVVGGVVRIAAQVAKRIPSAQRQGWVLRGAGPW